VEFANDGGYAHVIEDEQSFPKQFGKEIVAGILELPPDQWTKEMKQHNDTSEEIRAQMKQFLTNCPLD